MLQRQKARRDRLILTAGILIWLAISSWSCTLPPATSPATSAAVQEVTELAELKWEVNACLHCGEDYMTLAEVTIVRCPECVDWKDA